MTPSNPMFSKEWLDAGVAASVPAGLHMRPLEMGDFDKGYVDLLAQLTQVGDLDKAKFEERFQWLQSRNTEYQTVVIEDVDAKKVVASGTVLVESKFIRGGGKVGHIEDIVVDKSQRGKNLGKKVIEALTALAKRAGCYKTILCCDEKNVGFYEKCGYKKKEVEMVHYFDK